MKALTSDEIIQPTDSIQTEINRRGFQVTDSASEHRSSHLNKRDGLVIRLAKFLQIASSKKFKLGVHDCGLFLADWCLSETGVDPGRLIRGMYASTAEAQDFVGVSNLPKVFGRCFLASGFKLTKRPAYGDIAMIRIGDAPVRGAIVTDGFVVLSNVAGISRVRTARVVAAWSVHA
jgi:hypothetical protein